MQKLIPTAFLGALLGLLWFSCDRVETASLSVPVAPPSTAPSIAPSTSPSALTPDDIASLQKSPRIIAHPPGTVVSFAPDQWKSILTPLQFNVMFEDGTERPFQNPYNNEKRKGTYISAANGAPLFRSEDKFDSGTGWPSFTKPISPQAVTLIDGAKDHLGWGRTEVREPISNTHLGHVFDDGPAPTGKRYCMNSAAMLFVPDEP